MPTTDYFFTSIKPEPIIVSPHRGNHSKPAAQQAATQDQVSQQTHPLQPGKTRVFPSMLVDKQVPLCTSLEERLYSTVKGLVQVTQVALAHTMVQCNPKVEKGLPKQPKTKKPPPPIRTGIG